MTAIIGLNAFHPDSSACLLIDGRLVGAVAEERLGSRQKHTMSFPINAIKWLLSENGLRLSDITHIAIARSARANVVAKASYLLSKPSVAASAVSTFLSRQKNSYDDFKNLAGLLGEDPKKIGFKIVGVEHHLAHIASSYFVSDFDDATGFSYDGSGDFASAMVAECRGSKINIVARKALPDSLGHYYTAMCQHIGFDLFGEEYKVMGLAPYGEDKYSSEMQQIVDLQGKDWFKLNMKYFTPHRGLSEAQLEDGAEMRLGQLYSDKLCDLIGAPRRRGEEITQRQMDIAKSTQVHFESAAARCLNWISSKYSVQRLAMAGGCALNGVMNARIYRDFPVDSVYLQSASSDDGTSIGAAYVCWHHFLGKTDRFAMKHSFWGPEYTDQRIRDAITAAGLQCDEFTSVTDVIEKTADQISSGNVVGWYQGRSEWGPRALGNRSILANPAIPDMKDTINRKIKKRESFRPFAPSVLKEDVGTYFEQNIDSPFMMHVVKFKPQFRKEFPAVTHVDGTGRLQSVDRETNPIYHQLISAVKKRTGFGVVLNTSFNENEPVVDTPAQAIDCFLRTDMDALVLGRFFLSKGSS